MLRITAIASGLLLSLLIVTCCGFWLVRTIVRPLLQVDKRMQDIAAGEGDLNARINLSRDDEIGSLAGSVDRFIEKLQKMISATMDNNQHINQHVHTSVNRVEAISQSSRQTAKHAQALHHDSEQMVRVATSISDNCGLAAHNANEVRQLTAESSQYVTSASNGMQRVVVEVGECAIAINALKEQAGQIGQHFVHVHVALGTGTGLPDGEGEFVGMLARQHFVGGVDDGGRFVCRQQA